MADELDHYRQLLMDDRRETHALAAEARAALAQPVAPTDEELQALSNKNWRVSSSLSSPAIQPIPVAMRLPGPTKAELRQIFDDQSGYVNDDQVMWWADFHKAARAVLEQYGTH